MPIVPIARRLQVCLVSSLLAGQCGVAGTFYVNNRAGQDRYDGRSPRAMGTGVGPVRTVQTAIRRAHTGDTIILLPTRVPYAESIVVPAKSGLGSANYPLIIEGNGAELVGYREVNPRDWQYVKAGVYRLRRPFQPTGVLFSAIGALPREGDGLWGAMPALDRGEYAFWAGHYYFKPAKPFDLESHQLAEADRASGIVIDRTSHVIVRNFRVRGFRDDAIQVKGPASGVRIENCQMAECGRAGFSTTTNTQVEVVGSFVTGNIKAGVIAENYSRLTLDSCSVENNGDAHRTDATTVVNVTGGQPAALQDGPFLAPHDWERAEPIPESALPEEVRPVEPQ